MTADKITNIVGGIGAAAAAATPILNGVQGSLHQQDYLQLIFAVSMAVISWFTGKKG